MADIQVLPLVDDNEIVARVIFPPQMIQGGHITPAAFVLRPSINEEYLSVLRVSTPSFNKDIKSIIYGRKRSFYGYAIMRVDEINSLNLSESDFTVCCNTRIVDNQKYQSHAGIFILINGEPVSGAMSFENLPCGATQNHLLLAIRFCLTEIADRGLIAF
ncbi:MAG: hypothetical protein II956_06875 [Bacteroidales bacterium]|nr:hypothetical protein [Bacteroidales bacterium]